METVAWLENYFELFGNHAPNEEEIKLLLLRKKDVYMEYVADSEANFREIVPESKFSVLWQRLFPNCNIKPWSSLIGKCDTCLEFDSLIRVAEDPSVIEKLRQAHHMHRGGLFMLERME